MEITIGNNTKRHTYKPSGPHSKEKQARTVASDCCPFLPIDASVNDDTVYNITVSLSYASIDYLAALIVMEGKGKGSLTESAPSL